MMSFFIHPHIHCKINRKNNLIKLNNNMMRIADKKMNKIIIYKLICLKIYPTICACMQNV